MQVHEMHINHIETYMQYANQSLKHYAYDIYIKVYFVYITLPIFL